MHEMLHPFLNSYLDGELHGTRLQQMELHLASCETCQTELKELRRVSELLQKAPVAEIPRVDRFVANLTLILPQRQMSDQKEGPKLLWWLVPMGLLFDWFFVRILILVRDAVSITGTAGLLGQAAAWLNGSTPQPLWIAGINWISGGQAASGATINLLTTVNGFVTGLFSGFLWQAGIGLVYLGWLAIWWFKRRPQFMNSTMHRVRPLKEFIRQESRVEIEKEKNHD